MLVTENGLEFASAYIEFENSVLSDLIRSFFRNRCMKIAIRLRLIRWRSMKAISFIAAGIP